MEKKKSKFSIGKILSGFIKGDFFSYEFVLEYLPFIFYIVALSMLYISNNFQASKNASQISKINKELKELRCEYITTSAELMGLTRQSEIAGRSELRQMGIKESTVPPFKIYK